MTKAQAKAAILAMLEVELVRDDDILHRAHPEPDEIDVGGAEYARWDEAREALAAEFRRRSTSIRKKAS